MPKKIYHWVDNTGQSHYSDYLPAGQVQEDDKDVASEVTTVAHSNTTVSHPLNLNHPKIFSNQQNVPFSNISWVLFITCIFIALKTLKNNKKEEHKPRSDRYKKNKSPFVFNDKSNRSDKKNEKAEKGLSGELTINRLFSSNLDKIKYKIINGVTLKTFRGTTQIDHVLVSEFGIFVIETKNMSGWIHGSASQKKWTQTLSHTKEKYQFQNPVHQNYKHTKALQSLLKLDFNKFFPIVVFVGDSRFRTDKPENVFSKDEIIGYIKDQQKILFNEGDLIEIFNKIKTEQLIPSIENHIKHAEHVQSIIEQQTGKMI